MVQQSKRLMAGALLTGALITATGGATLAGQSTAFAATGTHAAATQQQRLAGALRKLARQRLARRVLTVQSVSGTTIAAATAAGIPITIDTSTTTTFTEAGATVTLAAVQTGEHIRISGSYNQVNRTAQARKVVVVVPAVSGVVTAVSGSTITLTDRNAVQHTITIGASAKFERAGQSAGLQNIAVGSLVTVQGTTNSDGSLNVLRVLIHVPRVAGTISNVTGASFTLTTRAGKAYTVTTSPSTIYVQSHPGSAPTTSTTAPSLTSGERAIVQGTLSGTNVNALRIALRQPKAPRSGTTTTPSA
ncbi:MAG TPA: DUF5666 domain-containing protein [Chloroflexota bacterium]|nr:DUF5666 domain-containing protein [Chloroflexota bacterium]